METRSTTPSVSLISLGCAKNQVDSETILSRFLERGFSMTPEPDGADLAIVNTCGFIGPAKEESIETILDVIDLKKSNPDLKVMVAGCLYQRYPQIEEELSEVDYWLTEPGELQAEATVVRVVQDMGMDRFIRGEPEMYRRTVLLSEPGTAYMRISQGCDRTCSFCAIPAIKGGLVSRSLESLVQEARMLSTAYGVKEINLVAQDLTNFGVEHGPNQFLNLLQALDEVESVSWYRLHYVYPFGLTRPMIEFLASSRRFARYLDMPFQHGDDEVLKVMRRGGSYAGNLAYIKKLREAIPGLAMRTTMLVGHPGETPEAFENLLSFLDEARFEWMGVFAYSPEENTHSSTLCDPPERSVIDDRVHEALQAYRDARDLGVFSLGRVRDALIVGSDDGEWILRSQTEAAEVDGVIRAPIPEGAEQGPGSRGPGSMVEVRVVEDDDLDFVGEVQVALP